MSGLHPADVQLATTPETIARCFAVMRELRTALTSPEEFVARIQQQQVEGFHMAFIEHQKQVVTVAGFRVQHLLATGLTMYVEDLVTGSAFRSRGHGKTMADWLIARARMQGCEFVSLDSAMHRMGAEALHYDERTLVTNVSLLLSLN